ncbi:hypothetical protein O6H91_08G056400 [Diphasiastrum complanatum]|nr:hypothetical protein O6H91_08G056400 [Diphasiastrum complanatum]
MSNVSYEHHEKGKSYSILLRLQQTGQHTLLRPFLGFPRSQQQAHIHDEQEMAGNDEEEQGKRLEGLVVGFTTPAHYAASLRDGLEMVGARPLWCPTIVVESTLETQAEVGASIWGSDSSTSAAAGISALDRHKGVAFTSRAGIRAFAEALKGRGNPLGDAGGAFLLGALGKDAELLHELGLLRSNSRARVVVPTVASPDALIEAFGEGKGQSLLCPVPLVIGLEEPPVVPNFLQGLRSKGWNAVRVNAYVTKWLGEQCAEPLFNSSKCLDGFRNVDALIFTSTAELEGLVKSLRALGQDMSFLRRQCVLAAHGPVTAKGAARLGVEVDVVGEQFQSFQGIIDALVAYFRSRSSSSIKI